MISYFYEITHPPMGRDKRHTYETVGDDTFLIVTLALRILAW